jgi:poly(3-hydroxybutyrate) depolymerase
VGEKTRDYFVYLPDGYDPQKPYRIVYQFHGCSSSASKENNNVPLQGVAAGEAILVRGRAEGNCWDTSSGGPDVLFFDAMVSEVEGSHCADTTRRFVSGYSSGGFMTQRLACERGGQLRGVASIAGGPSGTKCSDPVAALLIHDQDDSTVKISEGQKARDLFLSQNKCGATFTPQDPSPCVRYEGCAEGFPVVWCQTQGKGHDRQDGLASAAFWGFFSGLLASNVGSSSGVLCRRSWGASLFFSVP